MVATSAHLLDPKSGAVEVQSLDRERDGIEPEVLHHDLDSDLCLLRVPTHMSRDNWLALHHTFDGEAGGRCYSVGRDRKGWRPISPTVEGVGSDEAERQYIYLKDAQVVPGFSGSPLLELSSGAVIGQIRYTRNRKTDLGALSSLSSDYLLIDEVAECQSDPALAKRWRVLADKRSEQASSELWHLPSARRNVLGYASIPPAFKAFVGREGELKALASLKHAGRLAHVSGVPGAGKTEVLIQLLQWHNATGDDASVYLDLYGWNAGAAPVLRALIDNLGIRLPQGAIDDGNVDGLAAATARVAVALRNSPGLYCMDHADVLLASQAGYDEFQKILRSGLFRGSSVAIAARTDAIPSPNNWQQLPIVNLGALESPDASQLLVAVSDFSSDLCSAAIDLASDATLTPGALLRAAIADPSIGDVLELALVIESSHASVLTREMVEGASKLSDSQLVELYQVLCVAAVWPTVVDSRCIDREILGCLQLLGGLTNKLDELDLSTVSGVALHVLADEGEDSLQVPLDQASAILRTCLSQMPRTPAVSRRIEDCLGRVELAAPEGSAFAACLAEELALRTASEPLGPVISASAELADSWALRFLIACRSLLHLDHGLTKLVGLASAVPSKARPEELEVFRQALRELDGRFGFSKQTVELRSAGMESLDVAQLVDRTSWRMLLVDQSRALLELGFVDEADKWLVVLRQEEEGLDVNQGASVVQVPFGYRRVLEFQADFDAEPALLVEGLQVLTEAMRDPEQRQDAVLAAMQAVRTLSSRTLDPMILGPIMDMALKEVEASYSTFGAAAVSIAAAALRSVALRIPDPKDRLLMLTRAADLFTTRVVEDGWDYALLGDTRILLSRVRISLSLAAELNRSGAPDKAAPLRRSALDDLARLSVEAPTATVWSVYLSSLDQYERFEIVEQVVDPEEMRDVSAQLTKEIRRYRKWRSGKRAASRRLAEIDLWLLARRWASEGSIHAVVNREHANWYKRPLTWKLADVAKVLDDRERALDAIERRNGKQVDAALLRFRNRSQHQRTVAILQRDEPDVEGLLAFLDDAVADFGPIPKLLLARAEFFAYVWNYDDAIDTYRDLRSGHTDRVVQLDSVVGEAKALLDKAIFEVSDHSERRRLAAASLELVVPVEARNRTSAGVGLAARLEVSRSLASDVLEEVVDLLCGFGSYANAVYENLGLFVLAMDLSTELDDVPGAWYLLDDITRPSSLVDFASLLLRSFELSKPRHLRYLEAALICLDGARIMGERNPGTRHAFLEARVLLAAAEESGEVSPLGWAEQREYRATSDLDFAARRFQSIQSRSVGGFRRRAQQLEVASKQLARRLAIDNKN